MGQEEDKFSILPKMILHDILSRLPEEDAARTSVLSKACADTWSTFPILSFCDTKITGTFQRQMEDSVKKRENLIDYVNRTLLRFSDQGLAIKEFKFSVNYFEPQYMSKDVDLWLKLASENGVEVLELCLLNGPGQCYVLPTGVIEAKSLTKLVLQGRIRVDLAFMNHSIKFFSLRVLSLEAVLLGDEQAIEHLISCCPLIEHITLKDCSELSPGGSRICLHESKTSGILKSLSMCGLPKLKGANVQGIQEIYIDAPSLENLCFCPHVNAPFKMDFDRCRNLKQLYLYGLNGHTIITDKWFLELFLKFPFLESLELDDCVMPETINISSDRLKVLELSDSFNLMKEVNIDAPNLLSCLFSELDGDPKPIISFLRSSSQLEVNIYIHIDDLDPYNVKEFIQKNIKPQNVLASLTLSLFINRQVVDVVNPIVLQVSSPLPRIKHLHLGSVPENESLFLSLVNFLFSSCCPATISFSLNSFSCCRAFIEFFYETLKGRKEDNCVCSSGHTKCWWHGLKDVKVTCSMKIDENVDFKTMLELLPNCAPKKISIPKENGITKENISFRLEL